MFSKPNLFSFLMLSILISAYTHATPLTDAAFEQDIELVQLLLSQGEKTDILDEEEGLTALHIAIANDDIALTTLLVNQGADVNFKTSNQSVAIHIAINGGNLELLELLDNAGANLNALNENGQTALQNALNNQYIDIAEWLLNKKVDVNNKGVISVEVDKNNWNYIAPEYPIILALGLFTEDPEDNIKPRALINKMVSLGADLNVVDSEGQALIFKLLSIKHDDLINELIPAISNYDVVDNFNNSALHKVIKVDSIKTATSMIKEKEKIGKGAELADKVGYTAVHSAYEKGMYELIDMILDYENTSESLSPKGQTVYHRAYLNKQHPPLKRWLEITNDFNIINKQGDTLLHEAARQKDIEFVVWLISQGANPDIKNNKDQTPLVISIEAQSNELISILLPISDKTVRFKDNASLMHKAAMFSSVDIVKALNHEGVATDSRDVNGFLPAHTAINFGNKAVLKYLVSLIKPPLATAEPIKDVFSDPRLEYWSLLYWADMKALLLESVEKDLSSDNSSVLAPQVWVQTHNNLDDLSSEFETSKAKWAGRINVTASVKLLGNNFKYKEMVEQYPPSYAFTQSDIHGLISLAYAAGHLEDMSLKYDYLETAVRLNPNFWHLAWMYEYSDLLNNPEYRKRANLFASSEGIKGTLVGNYIAELMTHHTWSTSDRYNSLLKWLELSPNDPRALLAKSLALENKKYYSEALLAAEKSTIIFPFYSNRDQVPEMLIRQDKLEQAKAYIALTAEWYQHEGEDEPLDVRSSRYYSTALLATANNGAARKEIEPTLLKYPEQVRLIRQMAKLEYADSRYDEAASLMGKLIELDDKADSSDYKRYIEALSQSGEKRLALDTAEQALSKLSFVSEGVYLKALELAMDLEQTAVITRVHQQATEQLPDSILLVKFNAKWLWKQGKQKQALDLVEDLLVLRPNNSGFIKLWKTYSLEQNTQEEFIKLTRQKIDQYPWSKNWWNILVEVEGDSNSKKIALWNEANKKNATSIFFCQKIAELHTTNKNYEQSEKVIRKCLNSEIFKTSLHIDQQSLLVELFWLMERQSKAKRVESEFLEFTGKQLENYKEGHANLENYYRYLESLYRAQNNTELAAQALFEQSKLSKNNGSIYHKLVARYTGTLSKQQIQGYGFNMIQRLPYNKDKLDTYLHKQLLWSGSPINALKAIENAKKRGVDYDRSYERRALSELGDTLKLYENYSLLGKKPNASKRYLNWFDKARDNALTSERKEVIYDFSDEKSEVRIVQPNGEVITRKDHSIFGTVTHFKKGAAFINVKYDANGNMTQINDSSGQFVTLEYNAANKIERMIDSDNRILDFVYNAQGKPRIISIVGLGSIYVVYDEQGEIETTNSEQGHKMALQVTQAFQDLLTITKRVQKISSLGDIPSLPNNDKTLDKLVEEYHEAEYGQETKAIAQLSLARYLVDHVTDSEDYFEDANGLLIGLYQSAQNSDNQLAQEYAIEAIQLWYTLYKQVKPSGMPLDDFAQWSEMRTWLVGVAMNNTEYKTTLKKLDEAPLALLKDAQWLASSDIKNSGFWKRYGNEELYSPKVRSLEKQAVLIRRNGDILLASSKGLSVLRSGFWEWFAYDENQAKFSHTVSINNLGPSSNILSLAETGDGVLWLGSAKGLFAIEGDYDEPPKRWSTESKGLPSPRINTLKASGNSIYIASENSLSKLTIADEKVTNITDIKGDISEIILIEGSYNQLAAVLMNEQGGVYIIDGETQTKVTSDARKIVYNKQSGHLFWLNKDQLYSVEIIPSDGAWLLSDKQFIGQKNDLLHSKEIHEMSIWSVPGEGETLVVNTDLGINIFKDYYFQSMQLPFELSRGGTQLGPKLSTTDTNGDIVIATSEGVYTFQPSTVNRLDVGRVYDSLVDDSLGITYIATGSEILYIDHSSEELDAHVFSSVNARYLRLDNKGNLITNDGLSILRFNRGEETPQRLFSTSQSVEESKWQGELNDILIDSENTIWAASGSSVFRYKDSMQEPDEFNYFMDVERFPSRSQMIYKIYENLQGKIHVVASNEVHLSYKGVNLSGGILEWNGKTFKNLGKEGDWFVTGYTKIDATTAIVATNNDFTRETSTGVNNQRRESFDDINDPTFKEMIKKSSMIWLGKQGAQLGEKNTWLFPSAGGVVVYHEGKWFYPDRLNQLLPKDMALGQYGARAVHTVSIDKHGMVYVGTDLGLLVYESQGVASLLNDNHRGQVAFVDFETTKQQEVRNLFLSNIDPKSKQGKLINKYENINNQIAKIETNLNEPLTSNERGMNSEVSVGESKSNANEEVAEKLKTQLKARERSRQKLLANLEKNHYGLFQILKMDPREISAMHKKLSVDQAIIQYLPTNEKLFIQVVTNTGAIIRQVDVPKELLEKNSLEIATILRNQTQLLDSAKINRGVTLDDDKEDYLKGLAIDSESHVRPLSWLYHYLIRPVENDLEGKNQVFITPVGALTYVPFSALIRQVKPNIEYAIDRYNIGILPSMYHFNLVMHHSESFSDKGLFIADPDGSLPGARNEVQQITDSFVAESKVLEGNQASVENIKNELEDTRIIHFATHGVLNTQSPEDSYLLLANKYQFNVIDISMLDLEQTDIVVLSACESGIGRSGLEYASLARAFAHAKVPSVVASYWMVHDEATKEFMVNLYEGIENESLDNFSAMSYAKKKMIASRTKYSHPAAWASFDVFGKP